MIIILFQRGVEIIRKITVFMLLASMLTLLGCSTKEVSENVPVYDIPFTQEWHEPHTISNDGECVLTIMEFNNQYFCGTKTGFYQHDFEKNIWTNLFESANKGPVFDLFISSKGTLLIGSWNGIYELSQKELTKVENIHSPIAAIAELNGVIHAYGPDGQWKCSNEEWSFTELPISKNIRSVKQYNNKLWIATGIGLYRYNGASYALIQDKKELLSADIRDMAYVGNNKFWIGGLGGITVHSEGKRINHYTPRKGLPSASVNVVESSPDGKIWVGTDKGVARFYNGSWSVRRSKRWLLDDKVNDIIFDDEGNALIATDKGISIIKQNLMTLKEKSDEILDKCYSRHVREPYLVEKCLLSEPGDLSSWQPLENDNDGQYTGMYLAMESYRYADTGDPEAKENADKAYAAMKFLQTVTSTNGFVARSVIPSTWKNIEEKNRRITDQDWASERVGDPRAKRTRATLWRKSQNGKWWWKGDTSSDEITGHMYGYFLYYDLVANDEEKTDIREHIRKIVDYIIDSGFVLKDIDGTHTRWAVWSPEKLNDDPDWKADRGINSVEILSFLKLAYYVSGEERYQDEYLKLIHEHGYAENTKTAKSLNPSWRTHIDDELLALAYPCLLLKEDDPYLKNIYRESLDRWYHAVENDQSSFFNFIYGMCTDENPNLDQSIHFLQDAPLDLIHWRVNNSGREDVRFTRYPEIEEIQTARLLPPSERGVVRWDDNPWIADQGHYGKVESSGVFWLLPYWMGRYYGYIGE